MTGDPLDASAVAELAAGFQGQLIQPGEPEYDTARAVFNGMIDRRPALIARCAGDADVVAAVNFARARELLVAVRDTHIAWTRSLMDTMAPFTMPGVSLNFTSDQQASKARESFGSADKNRRLTALKDQYDPTNFFRLNQNIRPSAG